MNRLAVMESRDIRPELPALSFVQPRVATDIRDAVIEWHRVIPVVTNLNVSSNPSAGERMESSSCRLNTMSRVSIAALCPK
jgi:hypothetical protein